MEVWQRLSHVPKKLPERPAHRQASRNELEEHEFIETNKVQEVTLYKQTTWKRAVLEADALPAGLRRE